MKSLVLSTFSCDIGPHYLADRGRAAGGGGEIAVVHVGAQPEEACVEPRAGPEPLPDPFQGRDVAVDCRLVVGGRVDDDLPGPELEAGAIDLGGWPVAKLEVEGRLGDVQGRVAGP